MHLRKIKVLMSVLKMLSSVRSKQQLNLIFGFKLQQEIRQDYKL